MTIIEIIVTILLGTAAGFINTFAGGGSMLVVPFLIFIGLPANVANATNRIAILLQNVVSVNGFKQKKILDFKTDSKLLLPVALGTGVGLRYDLTFLVIRLDLGIALHAPYDTGKSGYYNIPKFKDGLGLHFAIGYPF